MDNENSLLMVELTQERYLELLETSIRYKMAREYVEKNACKRSSGFIDSDILVMIMEIPDKEEAE